MLQRICLTLHWIIRFEAVNASLRFGLFHLILESNLTADIVMYRMMMQIKLLQ